jgi:hypothetical protein
VDAAAQKVKLWLHAAIHITDTDSASSPIMAASFTVAANMRRGERHFDTVENFFSIFKRGVIGTYHHMSEAHRARYTAEFDFRYNTKGDTDAERADQSLRGIYGKRLTYRRPVALAA